MPARLSPRNRAKRGAKTAGAQSEDVPLFTRRRTGGEWVEVATLPPTNRLCRAIARSAVQKQPERRALRPQARFGAQPPQAALGAERGCSSVHPPPNRRRMGGGSNLAPHQQAMPRNRAKRGAKTAGAQSAAPAGAFRSATAAGGTWRGDRMFLCLPAAEQAANGWRRQPGLTAGGSSKPRTTANKLSPRRAKLALNVRIGCACRAHNHHKFSHRILQPHTKRRASHAD